MFAGNGFIDGLIGLGIVCGLIIITILAKYFCHG